MTEERKPKGPSIEISSNGSRLSVSGRWVVILLAAGGGWLFGNVSNLGY